ncbi:MAG: dihydroorotate dehydrogenase [Oscillospiraceae bacterium]|nr:dihydroorotate dehydrogenase [Oscillospiraceae bacterium]
MRPDLSLNLCGCGLKNPVIAASGTFGYGVEYSGVMEVSKLGGVCSKGLTMGGKAGNQGERLYETPSGLMNSIGLENPGVGHFIEHELPQMKKLGVCVIANLGGGTVESYEEGAALLDAADVDMIELNISCPNVKAGGIAYGIKACSAREVVGRVRAVCRHKPLMVKLSPNAENIVEMALACQEAGADALSLVNTFQAFAVDLHKRKPVFENGYAGLSGPAIKPIALRMVHQVCKSVTVPVVGLGGIVTGHDALEFIMAGAAAVQVGTANFMKPDVTLDILRQMEAWMEAEGVASLDEIRNIL